MQWLPFHLVKTAEALSILRTMQDVFPETTLWIDNATGIAVARRGALDEAGQVLRLETAGRARAMESFLSSTRADLAFLTGSPIFFGLESALAGLPWGMRASGSVQRCDLIAELRKPRRLEGGSEGAAPERPFSGGRNQ